MISKVAIQAGMGVTAVGGVAGIVAWQLIPESEKITSEYLVEVLATQTNGSTEDLIKENKKQYFCQWGENNNETKDNNCEIKKILFDATKKSVLLSKAIAEFNGKDTQITATENADKNNLKVEKNWFILKIKGYTDDLEKTNSTPKTIDILSTIKETNENHKKYTTVTPRFTLENNKATQGKTKTFLVKYKENKGNESITEFKCKWNNTEAKECYIYKFETQPTPTEQPITEISLENAAKLNAAVTENHYYIISFKENTELKTISSWNTNIATIISVEKKDDPNKKVGEFEVINPMSGEVTDTKAENLILLN